MKRVRKRNQKFIQGGILTFLMGAGLLFNANHPQVEAIDLSNSHLGTFEGSTTFTISSSTGIQPTLAIEVKNQDGSTQSYETSSGSLTIPNTKEGATIKSAILKGQTLINLSPFTKNNGVYELNASTHTTSHVLPVRLQQNKRYIFIFKLTNSQSSENSNFIMCRGLLTDGAFREFGRKIQTFSNGKHWFMLSSSEGDIDSIFVGTNFDVTLSDTLIIEYQDGMENWNIPYFTGMQSVKMPVLTITNGEPEQIKDEKGQWIPNPAFQSTAITFEEEIILRSNGEVYDELDLMTGKLTQRLDENNEVLAKPIVRAVNMKAEPVFKLVNQAEIAVVGDVKATMVSVTVPTAPLSFVLDPNKEPDQQFIASEFSLTNDTQAPLAIELKEFIQTTNLFNDVLPDYYDEWRDLTKEESKNISLGLVPQESESWLTLNPGTYYVADTKNAILGRVRSQSTVDFKFTALHGQAFDTTPQPQYRLTFVFGF